MEFETHDAAASQEGAIFQSNLPLGEKLDRARRELLDLSARNRLLNMPRGASKGRSIEIIDEKTSEVFRLLVREGKAFTFVAGRAAEGDGIVSKDAENAEVSESAKDADEITELAQPEDDTTDERGIFRRHADTRLQTRLTGKGLQKRLLELYLDAKTLEEEQGVNVLFLSLGALKWVDPNNVANIRYAPLLLVPVTLDRGNAGERFNLRARPEDFASNLSLEAYLDRVHQLRLPAFEANDAFDPLSYVEQVRASVVAKPDWEVLVDDMSVGFFSFAKFLMYRDLDPAIWPQNAKISDQRLVRGLLSDGFTSGQGMADEDANIDPFIPPPDMLHILDCDSSQALAIFEVRRGRDLVIQGPPGTGKSQTIANIIASAINDGKSVLFVAEKMAALEVVKRRLDEKGVGDACLELHSNKTNKCAVLEELRRTWELGAPRGEDPGTLFARLTEARDALNAHVSRLHQQESASGLSAHQVMGHLTRLRAEGEKANDLVLGSPGQWGRDGFGMRRDLLVDLATRVEEIGKPADHAWVGVGLDAIMPSDVERLITRIQSLRSHLTNAMTHFEQTATLLELEAPKRFVEISPLAELCQRVAHAPPLSAGAMANDAWLKGEAIIDLLREGQAYEQARQALDGKVTTAAWNMDLVEMRRALSELPENFGQAQFQYLDEAAVALPRLLSEADALSHALGRETGATLMDVDLLTRIGERVASAPPASPETFASDLWDGGVERAGDLAAEVSALEIARRTIGTQLVEMSWDIDLTSARTSLAAGGTSVFRFLSGDWRRAHRLVQSVVASPKQPLPVTLALLDTLARGQSAKRKIQDEDTFGRSAFGTDWRGERSNSAPMVSLVEWMRSLKGLGAEPRIIASRSPEKSDIGLRSKHLAQLRSAASLSLQEAWACVANLPVSEVGKVPGVEKADLPSLLQLAVRYAQVRVAVRSVAIDLPENVGQIVELLDQLVAGQGARGAIRTNTVLGQNAFGDAWQGDASNWTNLIAAAQWMASNDDIRALAGRVGERASLLPRVKLLIAAKANALVSFNAIAADLQLDLVASVGVVDLEEAAIATVAWRLDRWNNEHEQLFRWVAYRDRAAEATKLGCGDLVSRLGDGRLTPAKMIKGFEMAYFEATYTRMVRARPDLGRFDGATHGRLVREFAALDRERISAARVEVVKAHYRAVPPRDGGAVGPLGVLRGEIQKKKGHMPVRKLIERAGPALRALKPVFMMSPLSVAQFLPPGAMTFDLLVMDEASQIQPVDALGAVARANQVVVVGDPKQLPPTAFFAKMTAATDDDDDDDAGAPVADIESILGLFTARGLPMRMLRWHYRSRHQSLIAVSNQQFYENKLFIVPSPYTAHSGGGLQFHYVPDGLFDTGNKRNNLVEAKVVAQAIITHARNFPKLSLGVAAFSAAQRRAIIDELEILRRGLPAEVEDFFRAHRSEPFFVKNLENVQGDERDVIFISVGYGRSIAGGRVPMRFGPLGSEGGERRLNVLISRAKRRCDVFASMTDEDIEPGFAAGKKGVSAFRLFLQYARTGKLFTAEHTGRDFDSVFEEQVAHALRARGYEVQAQVGIAGFFIDLAIIDNDRPGRYLLGIECDGAAYHSAKSARDRDRLRQAVLEDHGWTIHRIWSTDWFQRPSEQLELVIRRIAAAKAEFDEHKDDVVLTEQLDEEAPYVEREDTPEASGANAAFAPYEEAILKRPAHRTEDLHETPPGVLTDMVVQAVSVEGPVHSEQVTTRIRDAWGLKRTGGRIEVAVGKSVDIAVRLGRIVRRGPFLSLPDVAPIARDRSEVTVIALRKAEMLPPDEIEAAIFLVVRQNFGATREQVIQAVARGLGIRNTSAQVRSAIDDVIGLALSARRLIEVGGMLTSPAA
jgi:very-short-patch-repair endonuclease